MSAQPVSGPGSLSERLSPVDPPTLERLLLALEELRDGNFRRRLVVTDTSLTGRIATVINQIAERNQSLVGELVRVREAVGQEGRTEERLADDGTGHRVGEGDAQADLPEALDIVRDALLAQARAEVALQADTVERQKGMPAASAARAA